MADIEEVREHYGDQVLKPTKPGAFRKKSPSV
jgi:hypothetical protein